MFPSPGAPHSTASLGFPSHSPCSRDTKPHQRCGIRNRAHSSEQEREASDRVQTRLRGGPETERLWWTRASPKPQHHVEVTGARCSSPAMLLGKRTPDGHRRKQDALDTVQRALQLTADVLCIFTGRRPCGEQSLALLSSAMTLLICQNPWRQTDNNAEKPLFVAHTKANRPWTSRFEGFALLCR